MQAFLAPLGELADYQEMLKNRRKGEGIIQVAGCVNSQKTHLMYALGDGCEYRVIAFSSEEKAKKAFEEYRFLTDNVYMYPARDLLFYHADIKGKLLTDRRMEVLRALLEKEPGTEITVITTMDAFLDGLPYPEEVRGQRIKVAGGDTSISLTFSQSCQNSDMRGRARSRARDNLPCAGAFWTSSRSRKSCRSGLNSGVMRLIRSGALTWKASDPWRIWRK